MRMNNYIYLIQCHKLLDPSDFQGAFKQEICENLHHISGKNRILPHNPPPSPS